MLKTVLLLFYFIMCFVSSVFVLQETKDYQIRNSIKQQVGFEVCIYKKDLKTELDCWVENTKIEDMFKFIKHSEKINELVQNNVKFSIKTVVPDYTENI